jgi:hypothetical protein
VTSWRGPRIGIAFAFHRLHGDPRQAVLDRTEDANGVINRVDYENETEVNMSATMIMLLSVSLFAGFFFVARSDDEEPDKSRSTAYSHPTGFENYV